MGIRGSTLPPAQRYKQRRVTYLYYNRAIGLAGVQATAIMIDIV